MKLPAMQKEIFAECGAYNLNVNKRKMVISGLLLPVGSATNNDPKLLI
jgi:hypothetical protein